MTRLESRARRATRRAGRGPGRGFVRDPIVGLFYRKVTLSVRLGDLSHAVLIIDWWWGTTLRESLEESLYAVPTHDHLPRAHRSMLFGHAGPVTGMLALFVSGEHGVLLDGTQVRVVVDVMGADAPFQRAASYLRFGKEIP